MHKEMWPFGLIFAEFAIPPFHSTIPVHRSSPVIVDYHEFALLLNSTSKYLHYSFSYIIGLTLCKQVQNKPTLTYSHYG